LSDLELHRFIAAGVSQRLHNHATKPAERLTLRLDIPKVRRRLI
jgi:hypothetical protein